MTTLTQQKARQEGRGGAIATAAPKQLKKREAPKTGRFMLKFWLDTNNLLENELNEYIESLKKRRMWSHSIRAAVALFKSLQEKRIDILFELFPWVKNYFDEMQARMVAEQMELIRQQLILIGEGQVAVPVASGPKQIAAPAFAMPVFEDDDAPTMLIRTDTSTNSAANFVNALKNMQ